MILLPIHKYISFFIFIAITLYFFIAFENYNRRQRASVLFGLLSVAIVTKILDAILLCMYDKDPVATFYRGCLPLFSCDIGLIMGIVLLFLHLLHPEKSYYTIDRFLVYMMLFNSLVPFLLPEFSASDARGIEQATEAFFTRPNLYELNNSIVHSIYFSFSLLYARWNNIFKKPIKGYWKCLVIYSGIVLGVHIINLILSAFGLEPEYMYTMNAEYKFAPFFRAIFGDILGLKLVGLFQAPIIEHVFGAIGLYCAFMTLVYLIHVILYKNYKKKGLDNLFYNNLIYPNDTFI